MVKRRKETFDLFYTVGWKKINTGKIKNWLSMFWGWRQDANVPLDAKGRLEPIRVIDNGGQICLMNGERRLRACQLASVKRVQAQVFKVLPGTTCLDPWFIISFRHAEWTYIEKGLLIWEYHCRSIKDPEIANWIGVSTSWVTRARGAASLVRDLVASRMISFDIGLWGTISANAYVKARKAIKESGDMMAGVVILEKAAGIRRKA